MAEKNKKLSLAEKLRVLTDTCEFREIISKATKEATKFDSKGYIEILSIKPSTQEQLQFEGFGVEVVTVFKEYTSFRISW